MYKTYELRIRPNKTQIGALGSILADCCETYNAALQERKEAWKLQRKSITYRMQQDEITELRKDPQFRAIAIDIQRDPLRHVDRAFKAFFRRCKARQKPGFPRFRARARYDSFTFNLPRVKGCHIRIPNLGDLRFKTGQILSGTPKTATVKRLGKKWVIRLCCDIGDAPAKQPVSNPVGIDLGLHELVTLSDGRKVENPRWTRKCEGRIAAASRLLARKQKRSKNRLRAKEVLRRAHQRASDSRKNYLHHVSKWLVTSYDLIAYEDLTIRNMSRSAKGTLEEPGRNVKQKAGLNRSIMDAAWGQLIWQLTYKAEWAGKWAVSVDPRGTSIRCSNCGEKVRKTLAVRQHQCECGTSLDRDENAARNVLALGMSAAGLTGSSECVSQSGI